MTAMEEKPEQTEAAEVVLELHEKHKDILAPVLQRINECTLRHDGDGIFFLHQSLITMADAIREMLAKGTIMPVPGPGAGSTAGMQ